MDFGEVLSATWNVSWRHKYLWVLGLFALTLDGCGSGPGANFNLPSGDFGGLEETSVQGGWPDDPALWLGIAALGLLLGAVLLVVSVMAAAGLIAGADQADSGVPGKTLGTAWRRGVGRFWALLGLLVFILLVALVVFIIVAIAVGVPIVLFFVRGEGPSVVAIAGLVAGAIFIGLAALILGIVAQIVLSWSYRSLVIDSTGVFASLGRGWRLFRENLGASVLAWAVAFGLQLALGLAILVPLIGLLIPGVIALALIDGGSVAVIPLVIAAVVVGVIVGLFLKAFATTFFAAYWTIAYRRLTGLPAGSSRPASLGPVADQGADATP